MTYCVGVKLGAIPGSWLAITRTGVTPAKERGIARPHCPRFRHPFTPSRLMHVGLWERGGVVYRGNY